MQTPILSSLGALLVITTCTLPSHAEDEQKAQAVPREPLSAVVVTEYVLGNGQTVTNKTRLFISQRGLVKEESALGSMIIDVKKGVVTLVSTDRREALEVSVDRRDLRHDRAGRQPAKKIGTGVMNGHRVVKTRGAGLGEESVEVWHAPDLGLALFTRVEDRGRTVMTRTVTEIVRGEPSIEVFTIPDTYRLEKMGRPESMGPARLGPAGLRPGPLR